MTPEITGSIEENEQLDTTNMTTHEKALKLNADAQIALQAIADKRGVTVEEVSKELISQLSEQGLKDKNRKIDVLNTQRKVKKSRDKAKAKRAKASRKKNR